MNSHYIWLHLLCWFFLQFTSAAAARDSNFNALWECIIFSLGLCTCDSPRVYSLSAVPPDFIKRRAEIAIERCARSALELSFVHILLAACTLWNQILTYNLTINRYYNLSHFHTKPTAAQNGSVHNSQSFRCNMRCWPKLIQNIRFLIRDFQQHRRGRGRRASGWTLVFFFNFPLYFV